jgi:hypothetical protein
MADMTPRSRKYVRRERIRQGALIKTEDSRGLYKALTQAEGLFSDLLEKIDAEKVEITSPNDVYKISTAFAAILKARVEVERWECERNGLFKEALEKVTKSIQEEMASHPDLLAQLQAVFDEAARKGLLEEAQIGPPYSEKTPPPPSPV